MPGRSPLKQPGVPSKETAAEHARRIAKTRVAYANMSRRGGALHGALRPGSAASDRGAPKTDPRPKEKHASRTGHSVDVLAALAYARGAERARPTRESDDSDGADDSPPSPPPRTSLRSRQNPNLSSPDDPLTPSRAWFARSTREGRPAVSASDSPEDAVAAMRRRGGDAGAAAAFAAARAKRARAAAHDAAAGAETAVANMLAELARRPASPNASPPRARAPSSSAPPLAPRDAPPPTTTTPRVAKRSAAAADESGKTEREDAKDPFRAFAAAAATRGDRSRSTGPSGHSASASSALAAARDALAAAAAANAELARAAARTPAARARPRPRRVSDSNGDAEDSADARRTTRARRTVEDVDAARSGDERSGEADPPSASGGAYRRFRAVTGTATETGTRAVLARRPAALGKNFFFSAETRRALDDGRARRAELLAAYEALAARCAAARASSPSAASFETVTATRAGDETARPSRRRGVGDVRSSERGEDRPAPTVSPDGRARATSSEDSAHAARRAPFVVPSREDTVRLIREMEDRARRAHAAKGRETSPARAPAEAFSPSAHSPSRRGLRKFRLRLGERAVCAPSFERRVSARSAAEKKDTGAIEPDETDETDETDGSPSAARERSARASESDESDDSAGLTPPPRETDAARRFFSGGAAAAGAALVSPREGTDISGFDVPGCEPEVGVSDVRDFESLVAYAFQ